MPDHHSTRVVPPVSGVQDLLWHQKLQTILPPSPVLENPYDSSIYWSRLPRSFVGQLEPCFVR